MASGGTNPVITGSYEGTGALLTINTIGFTPKAIQLLNATTGATAEWSDTMGDDAIITHDSGTDSIGVVANGITPTATGFTVGTDSIINTAADVVHYTVWGQ